LDEHNTYTFNVFTGRAWLNGHELNGTEKEVSACPEYKELFGDKAFPIYSIAAPAGADLGSKWFGSKQYVFKLKAGGSSNSLNIFLKEERQDGEKAVALELKFIPKNEYYGYFTEKDQLDFVENLLAREKLHCWRSSDDTIYFCNSNGDKVYVFEDNKLQSIDRYKVIKKVDKNCVLDQELQKFLVAGQRPDTQMKVVQTDKRSTSLELFSAEPTATSPLAVFEQGPDSLSYRFKDQELALLGSETFLNTFTELMGEKIFVFDKKALVF